MMIRSLRRFNFVWLLIGVLLISAIPTQAFAASPTEAKISFTFDDGFTSTLLAANALQPYGYTGTAYIATNCIGMAVGDTTTACDVGNDKTYLTWAQVAQLNSQYGWEIGSHAASHPLTAAVDNPLLTDAGLDSELSGSQAALKAHGFQALSFASPYGDYDNRSIAALAKYYTSHRVFQDFTYSDDPIANTFPYFYPRSSAPYNDLLLTVAQVQGNVSVATIKSYIDQAKANGQWLILVFHDIKSDTDTTYDPDEAAYQTRVGDLQQIAAYAKSVQLPNSSMTGGLMSGYNLMPNSGFSDGITGGWAANAAAIKLDSQASSLLGHGSYDGTIDGPLKSIKVTNTTAESRLTSPKVSVTAGTTYTLKNFVNVTSTTGQVNFSITEYDANNTVIGSAITKEGIKGTTATNDVQVGSMNFNYTPSSANVQSASLTVTFKGSGLVAYVDNLQWLSPTLPGPRVVPARGDVNGDTFIDALDLSTVLSRWNTSQTSVSQGDLNSDGVVDALDLSIVLSNWSS